MRDDPAAPDLPRGVVLYRWRERKRTVGLPIRCGDYPELSARLRGLIDSIAPRLASIAYDVGYEDAPVVTLPTEDALSNPELLLAPIYAEDGHRSAGQRINEFTLFPNDGSWAIKVIADGPRWKVETTADQSPIET